MYTLHKFCIDCYATKANIKRIMDEKGISVTVLQRMMGYKSPQSIYKLLNMKKSCFISLDGLVQMSKVLEIPLDDLIVTEEYDIDIYI